MRISRNLWGLEENCTGRKCSSWSFLQDRSLTSYPMTTYSPKNPLKWVQIKIYAFSTFYGDFLTNISRCMRSRGKFVGIKNVPRKISYKIGHPRVSLDLLFKLEIHWFKNVKVEIFDFFTFRATLLRISRDRIVGIKNVPRKISYKVAHSRVSLNPAFNQQLLNMKESLFSASCTSADWLVGIDENELRQEMLLWWALDAREQLFCLNQYPGGSRPNTIYFRNENVGILTADATGLTEIWTALTDFFKYRNQCKFSVRK